MSVINVLDKNTIDKIAAGEVIDRPASIVKEMLENSIDAKATSITVEIKDGGISLIRITDNGCGISSDDLKLAFKRHATSKIRSIEDLICVSSLGFRGEALSSISAVSQMECITKTPREFTGFRYVIEGGEEKSLEEIGAPNGTTFIIKNLFYNTPARRKFLKSSSTEAAYISSIIEHITLSHPEISIRYINNSNNKIYTAGNDKTKDIIYTIYGREIAANLLEVNNSSENMSITGYIGKPIISRGNRNYMNYFINGRYIKSKIIYDAIETAYKPFMMQHNYPFCVLHFSINQELLDVNVHPSKMEIRFENGTEVYEFIYNSVTLALSHKEFIPDSPLPEPKISADDRILDKVIPDIKKAAKSNAVNSIVTKPIIPEPFEVNRINQIKEASKYKTDTLEIIENIKKADNEQLTLFNNQFLSKSERIKHKIIGQLFDTYWLVEYEDKLYIIDQHAAHEKVLYEKTLNALNNKEFTSQLLNPPIVLTLNDLEAEIVTKFMSDFEKLGYEIDHFGGMEYSVRAVPGNLYSIGTKELLMDLIDSLTIDSANINSEMITNKIASMSCKAAVKGNNHLSTAEADKLIEQLLSLDNPYNCPHGRPTIISMSKYELEKKFKRKL